MFAHFKFRNGERLRIGLHSYICTYPKGVLHPQPGPGLVKGVASVAWIGELPDVSEHLDLAINDQITDAVTILLTQDHSEEHAPAVPELVEAGSEPSIELDEGSPSIEEEPEHADN